MAHLGIGVWSSGFRAQGLPLEVQGSREWIGTVVPISPLYWVAVTELGLSYHMSCRLNSSEEAGYVRDFIGDYYSAY